MEFTPKAGQRVATYKNIHIRQNQTPYSNSRNKNYLGRFKTRSERVANTPRTPCADADSSTSPRCIVSSPQQRRTSLPHQRPASSPQNRSATRTDRILTNSVSRGTNSTLNTKSRFTPNGKSRQQSPEPSEAEDERLSPKTSKITPHQIRVNTSPANSCPTIKVNTTSPSDSSLTIKRQMQTNLGSWITKGSNKGAKRPFSAVNSGGNGTPTDPFSDTDGCEAKKKAENGHDPYNIESDSDFEVFRDQKESCEKEDNSSQMFSPPKRSAQKVYSGKKKTTPRFRVVYGSTGKAPKKSAKDLFGNNKELVNGTDNVEGRGSQSDSELEYFESENRLSHKRESFYNKSSPTENKENNQDSSQRCSRVSSVKKNTFYFSRSRLLRDISPEKVEKAYGISKYSFSSEKENVHKSSIKESAPKTTVPHRIGFPNNRNTCYLNSVLQALFGLVPFVSDYGYVAGQLSLTTSSLSHSISQLMLSRSKGHHADIRQSLRSVKENLARVDVTFSGSKMQDANEFLTRLLDTTKDEIDRCHLTTPTQDRLSQSLVPSDVLRPAADRCQTTVADSTTNNGDHVNEDTQSLPDTHAMDDDADDDVLLCLRLSPTSDRHGSVDEEPPSGRQSRLSNFAESVPGSEGDTDIVSAFAQTNISEQQQTECNSKLLSLSEALERVNSTASPDLILTDLSSLVASHKSEHPNLPSRVASPNSELLTLPSRAASPDSGRPNLSDIPSRVSTPDPDLPDLTKCNGDLDVTEKENMSPMERNPSPEEHKISPVVTTPILMTSDVPMARNPIKDNFMFQMLESYRCSGCGEVEGRKQEYFSLYVNPREDDPQGDGSEDNNNSMQAAIAAYMGADQRELKCEKCGHNQSSVVTSITRLPRILIIQLKRYDYKPDLGESIKRSSRVVINRWLTLDPFLLDDVTSPPPWDHLQTHSSVPVAPRTPKPTTLTVRNLSSEMNACEGNKENDAPTSCPPSPNKTADTNSKSAAEREEEELQEVMRRSMEEVGGQQEEDEIQQAIRLSLQDLGMNYTEQNQAQTEDNEGDDVSTGDEEAEQSRHAYRLMSVVSHYGLTTNTGHYVADVYNEEEQTWIQYDDDYVSLSSENVVLRGGREKNGYIFFYMHRSLLQSDTTSTTHR